MNHADFEIFLVWQDIEQATAVKTLLTNRGYSVFLIPETDLAMDRIQAQRPHLVVIDPSTLTLPPEHFIQKVQHISSEISFLIVSTSIRENLRLKQTHVIDILEINDQLQVKILWAVEDHFKYLYRVFQNEGLFSQFHELETKIAEQSQKILFFQDQLKTTPSISFADEFQLYQSASSLELLLKVFFERVQKISRKNYSGLFLKSIASIDSMAVFGGTSYDWQKWRGYGIKTESLNPKNVSTEVIEFMREVVGVEQFISFPFISEGILEGLFVFWCHQDKPQARDLENAFYVFHVFLEKWRLQQLKNENLEKKSGALVVPIEDLEAEIKKEISRSQRIKIPVAMARFHLDQFSEIKNRLGTQSQVFKIFLDSLQQQIQKSLRMTDLTFRVSDQDWIFLFPHTSSQGAVQIIEKIKNLLESLSMKQLQFLMTASAAISEYPSFCNNSDGLLQTSQDTLSRILENGGHRVAVSSPGSSSGRPPMTERSPSL